MANQEFILALKEQDKVDFIKTLILQFAPGMPAADVAKLANITVSNPIDLDNLLTSIAGKVDKIAGKGLSENDYTTVEKALVASALQTPVDITGKVDKIAGKGLSKEDFTTALKTKLSTMEGSHFKGAHLDEAALLAAHATAEAGSYAYVVVHSQEHIFIWNGTAWEDTGSTGAAHLTDAQIKT